MSSFPTNTESSTTLANLIPEIWGEQINDFFKLKLVLADFFTDRSDEVAMGGDTIHTPVLTEMTANAKSNATAVTLNNATESVVDLTVNQWYEVSYAIEDREAAQVKKSYYLQRKYAENAGYTIGKKLEVALAALFAGFSNTIGASTTVVADSDVRGAIATLEGVGIDTQSDTAFFMHPVVFWKQLQALDRFALALNSPVNDPTAKRPQATLYGIPVFMSNNLPYVSSTTGRWGALAHKDALHFATASLGTGGSASPAVTGKHGVRVQSNYVPEYLSTLTTADILYGVIENRDNAGVGIITSA